MKNYKIVASKEVVATVTVDGELFKAMGNTWSEGIAPFLEKHPEFAECPYDASWDCSEDEKVVYKFYSIGNPVVEEI